MAVSIEPIFSFPFFFVLSILCCQPPTTKAVDFLFNSFPSSTTSDLLLVGDARLDSSVIRLTNDANQFSLGRAFYKTQLPILNTTTGNGTTVSSFSTSFVFSILPQIPSSPGFGLAFVLTNSTSPPDALTGQYFGLFSNKTRRRQYPLFAVEFDTGRNPEFNEQNGNHVGIDLNYISSSFVHAAGYYLPSGDFQTIDMRSGANVRAWIDFDGGRLQINVTIAPAEITQKPERPLINYSNVDIKNYLSSEMYVGFSASIVSWVEAQRVLAWSLSDTGEAARDLNTTNLPIFLPPASSSSSSRAGLIAGVTSGGVVLLLCSAGSYYFCYYKKKKRRRRRMVGEGKGFEAGGAEEVEDWEMEYWPRRFSYDDLWKVTDGFSRDHLLGTGGFGKVYKGVLSSTTTTGQEEDVVAVKCISHDSKQGVREFMAEISSMGRLQHKNLVQMRGWCRRGNDLMLVYDYMPNGSLDKWVFPTSSSSSPPLVWRERKRVLLDVAEGLLYLHEGWEKVVLHRDVKPSNILMDRDMRGRLGDFGLAKLHGHNEAATTTRVVGTVGYLAPEFTRVAAPTKKSDVYSYGVVVLEVCCGRRAIEMDRGGGGEEEEEDCVLVDWVRGLSGKGRVVEAVDGRMDEGEEAREQMELVVKLGLVCCHPDPEKRVTMKEVVEVLVGVTEKDGSGGGGEVAVSVGKVL